MSTANNNDPTVGSSESDSHPPPLLSVSTSGTTPQSEQSSQQDSSNANKLQQEGVAATTESSQADCVIDFDGDWVSNTVQSAVTHFFGSTDYDDDQAKPPLALTSCAPSDGLEGEEGELSAIPCMSPSSASATIIDTFTENVVGGASAAERRSSATLHKINTTTNDPFPLLDKARSYSPSFSLFSSTNGPTAAGCGVYSPLHQCNDSLSAQNNQQLNDETHSTGINHSTSSVATGETKSSQQQSYTPYYLPSDFTPQTWLDAIQSNPSTILGAGAAVLTAVIVIHPLALIGAAATAAVSATAMWAVGFFHEVDKGIYQIWSEEFGMLFWEDNTNQQSISSGGRCVPALAATATSGSAQIIQKDEEHLRRVFLLEQERRKMGEKVKVVKVEESGQIQEVKADETSTTVTTDEESVGVKSDTLSKSAKDMGRKDKSAQQPPSRVGYILRHINSAPVSGNKSKGNIQLEPSPPLLDRPHTALSVEPRIESSKSEQPQASPSGIDAKPPSTATPTSLAQTTSTKQSTAQQIEAHYPPLEICVVRDVELPGLNTTEFFKVFFADDAPYSFKDFQKQRGDVEIVYGQWQQCTVNDGDEELFSVKKAKKKGINPKPFPVDSTRERTLKFNTLTKSYFGPAYGLCSKTQRATQLSNHLLVIENVTQLADIPFSDRFRVLERWIIEAVKNENVAKHQYEEGGNNDNDQQSSAVLHDEIMDSNALYTCKLSVHAEVQMLKSCSWESQIRKKASETFTEVVTEWCNSATLALRATEEQKRKRLRIQDSTDGSGNITGSSAVNGNLPLFLAPPASRDFDTNPTSSNEDSELFARHKRNFDELDKRIAKGDLDWCSIEVMHSLNAGRQSAFATVLEDGEIPQSLTEDGADNFDAAGVNGSRRTSGMAAVMMRRKSRKLFKKLSARVGSKPKSPR